MKPKVIKTEAEYQEALAYVETLMDAAPGSPEEAELELFGMLIEQYEDEHYPIDLPDPIDAILFRMDQAGLTRKDLAPYLGSASKVSEVLNRKRPLSVSMMRALHKGLGIPADVLLQEPGKKLTDETYDIRDFPFAEMVKSGYFGTIQGGLKAARAHGEELLASLFDVLGETKTAEICCRHANNTVDHNALRAWQARVVALTQTQALPSYKPDALDESFFKKVIRASYFDEGPTLVPRLLRDHGIHFVVLKHLSKTYLDGAAFLTPAGHPVVAMTLRFDRLDNFWFTLIHELVHVDRHLGQNHVAFFDDTEGNGPENDPREKEANEAARDLLILSDVWQEKGPKLRDTNSEGLIEYLAEELEISPAIIAGRIRWETGDYTRFRNLIGNREVRKRLAERVPELVGDE